MRTEDELTGLPAEPLGVPSVPAGLPPAPELGGAPEPEPRSQWQLFRRRFFRHRLAVIGGLILLLLYVVCFGAKFFAPFDKGHQNLLLGPSAPSKEHWMGTDELGRDELTEIMYAGQVSLKIGMAVALISTAIGSAVGAIAGYFGRWVDQVLMRVTDLFLVVPGIAVVAIAVQKFKHVNAIFGVPITPDIIIILVLAGLGWTYIARVVRGQVLSIKEKEFVEAARAAGAPSRRIITRHILPNCIGPIVVNTTLGIAAAIVTESTLSFLGFGLQKPATSWGNMLADSEGYYSHNTHLLYFPGLMILITVLCVNFLGDGLRDAFDPQSHH